MRPIALTRKNALFAGSDEGTENWAVLASLIETCKLRGVNPEAYFTDVLTKFVNNWPNSRRAELLPWTWTLGPPDPASADRNGAEPPLTDATQLKAFQSSSGDDYLQPNASGTLDRSDRAVQSLGPSTAD